MYKTVFVLAHINKCRIKSRHDFAHLANEDVAHMNLVARLVLVELDELLVLKQCNLNFTIRYGYD